MGRTKKVGIAGKYGSRYGLKMRKKLNDLESQKSKNCPYCKKNRLKRVAPGIWECGKCNSKFAGGAYTPKKVSR